MLFETFKMNTVNEQFCHWNNKRNTHVGHVLHLGRSHVKGKIQIFLGVGGVLEHLTRSIQKNIALELSAIQLQQLY